MNTGTAWPHLLADLKAKRAALDQVIDLLETQFTHEAEAAPSRVVARRGRTPGPKKRAEKSGRTDGRTEQNARRSEPP